MSQANAVVRFRHNSAITVAAIIVAITGLSLWSWAKPYLPLLVIPLLVAVWGWRAGTDVTAKGVTVRAALGSRRVAWAEINQIAPDGKGRVVAHLTSGRVLPLTAVTTADLATLVAVAQTAPAAR